MFQTTNQKLFTKFWGLQFKAYTISIYFPHTSTDCAKVQLVHVPKAAARTRFPHDASVSSFLYRSRTRLRCYAHGAPRWCHRPTGRIILYKYELAKVLESTHQTLTYTNQISNLPLMRRNARADFNPKMLHSPGWPSLSPSPKGYPLSTISCIKWVWNPSRHHGFYLMKLLSHGHPTPSMTLMICGSPMTQEPYSHQDLTMSDRKDPEDPWLRECT